MYSTNQIDAFREDVRESANKNGITAEAISISIYTDGVPAKFEPKNNPKGMPLKEFCQRYSKSKKGRPLAYNTTRTWEMVGKIKIERVTAKYHLVTEFLGKRWDGRDFTILPE